MAHDSAVSSDLSVLIFTIFVVNRRFYMSINVQLNLTLKAPSKIAADDTLFLLLLSFEEKKA